MFFRFESFPVCVVSYLFISFYLSLRWYTYQPILCTKFLFSSSAPRNILSFSIATVSRLFAKLLTMRKGIVLYTSFLSQLPSSVAFLVVVVSWRNHVASQICQLTVSCFGSLCAKPVSQLEWNLSHINRWSQCIGCATLRQSLATFLSPCRQGLRRRLFKKQRLRKVCNELRSGGARRTLPRSSAPKFQNSLTWVLSLQIFLPMMKHFPLFRGILMTRSGLILSLPSLCQDEVFRLPPHLRQRNFERKAILASFVRSQWNHWFLWPNYLLLLYYLIWNPRSNSHEILGSPFYAKNLARSRPWSHLQSFVIF